MKKILERINTITAKIEVFILSASILLMMVNTTANGLGRYLFNQSLYFSEELNQFLMVSVTFIGFAYAVRNGRNIRMTAIYDSLSHKNKKKLTMFIAIITAALMFFFAYQAVIYVSHLKEINRLSPALQLEVYIIYAIVPVGFFMAGIQFLIRFIQNIFHEEIYLSYDVIEEKDLDIKDQAC